MLEADKAILERTQNALDQCLAWLERDTLIDALELHALVPLHRSGRPGAAPRGRCGPHR